MNSSEKAESKVSIYLYCLEHKSTPSGGLGFEQLVFAHKLDYSKESMIRLDELLKQINNQNLYAKERNQKHKENFLIMLACYIGEYCKRLLSSKHNSIYWVDTLDILSNSNKAIDSNSSLWFTSLALHVNGQILLPLMMVRQHLESVGSNLISSQVFEWISDINSREISEVSTQQVNQKHHSLQTSQNHLSSHNEVANTTDKSEALSHVDSSQNTTKTSKATHDLTDLKTTIEQQKSQLISEQKALSRKSIFARLFTNPFRKKTTSSLTPKTDNNKPAQSSNSHLDNVNIKEYAEQTQSVSAKSIKIQTTQKEQSVTTDNQINIGNVSVEKTKPDITNTHIQVQNHNSKVSHPIVEQLEVDREVESYLPNNEEFIKVIDYNSDPMKELLTEKIKEKNTSAMVALASFKLEEFFIQHPLNQDKKLSIKTLQPTEEQILISIMKLIESAANKDNAAALFFLCSCYEQGFIYEADKTKYNLLLKRSAANGHRRAIKQLSILLKNDFQVPMESQTNQNINDDMILWIVGGLAFAIGFFIFF